MVKIICGWCRNEFEFEIFGKKGDRNINVCPHCGRKLPSSKKESTGNFIGKKHIHIEYKNGDVA